MNKKSNPYGSEEFSYIFDAAEINRLAAKDAITYSESHYKYEETLEVIADTYLKGFKQGMEKVMEKKGMEKGREYEKLSMARKLREAGMSSDFIESITGLTEY